MPVQRSHSPTLPRSSDAIVPGPGGAGRVAAECDSITAHLRMLSEHIGSRPSGTEEGAAARRYVEHTIRSLGGSPEIQPFSMVIPRYQQCTLVTDTGRVIPCLPVLGSASTPGALRGIPTRWRDGGASETQVGREGGFLLCPVGPNPTSTYLRLASERKASGVLLYHPNVLDLYSEILPNRDDCIPCVTVRRADAEWLSQERPPVRLNVTRAPLQIWCSNILVEVGTVGRPLLILAHYDTRPGSPGALCNASGTAVLLELLSRLRGWAGPQILMGFLDAEELGAAGSRHCRDVLHAVGSLKLLRGVIYLSGVGLQSLAVLPLRKGPTVAQRSGAGQFRLSSTARQCALDAGVLLCEETCDPGHTPVPPGVWPCPAIALTGPPMSIRHTSADLPDFIHPKYLLKTVAALDRLVRASCR